MTHISVRSLLASILVLSTFAGGQGQAAVSSAVPDSKQILGSQASQVKEEVNRSKGSVAISTATWTVLPKRKIRATPQTGEVFQMDKTPVAGRKILMLVHGGGAEKRPYLRWRKMAKALASDPDLTKQFKIFFYRYNTEARLDVTSPQLKEAVLRLSKDTGAKQISLLCLSMGGNLAQRAMLDPAMDSAVDTVFCMGTPFHGSPLFSADWFQYSLNKQWYMPWARPVHNLDYLLYFSRHKILQEDLKWDNFDKLIPHVGKFNSELGLGPKGDLTPEADANPELASINKSKTINKSKFVAYGGYLVNIYMMTGTRKLMEQTVLAPFHYVFVKLPVQIGREHPALRMLNKELANLKVNPDAPVYGPPSPHSYMLNDGIAPVSSALYLPAGVIREDPMLLEDELPKIRKASDVRLVRVFRDIDHISFLDGVPPKHLGSQLVSDRVHPEDGQRRIFQWLIKDLLECVPDSKAAAVGSSQQ
jgi:hypothetical protein